MLTSTGKEVCTLGDKMKLFSEHYNDLYKSLQPEENDIQQFLNGIELPGLIRSNNKN